MRAPPIAYLEASMYRSKGLKNWGRAKTGAEYNSYLFFQKPIFALFPKSMAAVTITNCMLVRLYKQKT